MHSVSCTNPEHLRAQTLVERANELLRQRDIELRRLQSLFESVLPWCSPTVVTEGGIVRVWSPRMHDLTGIEPEEAIGRPLTRTAPGLARPVEEDRTRPQLWADRTGRSWTVEHAERDGWQVTALEPALLGAMPVLGVDAATA